MELTNIKTIERLLEKHGFAFKKSLGQNFLINPTVCPRMAEASGADKGCGVLEVGPGIGVLTKELAKKAAKVVSVELDSRLIPILGETLAEYPNAKVINADILKTPIDYDAVYKKNYVRVDIDGKKYNIKFTFNDKLDVIYSKEVEK